MAIAIPRVITNDSATTLIPGGGSLVFPEQNHYFKKTFSTAGNRRTWTCSYWAKLDNIAGGNTNHILGAWIDTNNRDNLYYGSGNSYHYNMKLSGAWHVDKATDARYRDPGWFHFCHVWDTTQSSAGDRCNTYVNGVDQSWGGGYGVTDPGQNDDSILMAACNHWIGAGPENDGSLQASNDFEGYLSQFYFIDGQALDVSNFGYTDRLTNTWRPKNYPNTLGDKYPNTRGDIWSSVLTAPGSGFTSAAQKFNCFNGDATNAALAGTNNATNANLLFTPATTITGVTKLRVYMDHSTTYRTRVNGGSWATDSTLTSGGNASWRDLTSLLGGTTLTSIESDTDGANNGVNWSAIEINGNILVDGGGYGQNGYYLPFDGRSPIGEDKSGRGNDWTGVLIQNQTTYDKATAGFPILNTVSAGAVGTSGLEEDYTLSTPTGVEGCVAFDGSSDSLFCEDGAGVRFGTDPFTIEGWFYVREHEATVPTIISKYDNGDYSWIIRTWTDDKLTVQTPESGGTNHYSTYTVPVGVWIHFAYVREGTGSNEAHIYVNGTNYGTWTDDNNYDDTNDIYIGRQDVTNTNYFNGFISNIRLVNGTAVYTADFDVPTKPLENITNTKLLCCQSSTMVGAALTAPTMGGLNDGTYWGGQGSSYIGNIWSDPQDTSGSGSFWPGSMFSGQTSGHANNVGPYSSGKLIVDFGKTWEGSTDFIIYGRLYQNDLYKDQDGNTLYTQGSSGSGNIENRSFTASDVSRIIVDAISNNGNSSFIANISVDGEQLRDPLNKLPGSTSNNPVATRSESSGSCVLALPLNASNTDYSPEVNEGTSRQTAAVWGATAKTDEGHFYGSSYYFDGSNDEIIISDATAFDVENNEFTAECWWNIDSFSGNRRVFTSGNGTSSSHKSHFQLVVTTAGLVRFDYDATAGHSLSTDGDIVVADTWYHTAIQRNLSSGTATMEIYLNGVLTASTTSNASFDMNNTEGVTLGRESTGSNWWQGWIQDFRFYNGVAKYKKNFIPPGPGSKGRKSGGDGVVKDSPGGVAYSSFIQPSNGSLYFDGSGDYLSLSDSADWNLGSGDFTIEAFIYGNSFGSYEGIIAQWPQSGAHANNSWVLEPVSGDLEFYYCHSGATLVGPIQGGTLTPKKWHHVAAVRSSNTMYIFIDGIMYGSGTSVTQTFNDSSADLTIGGNVAGAGMFNGFISNARVVKGTALYTTNFTPPTKPLTNVTNTKLLCCQSNTSTTTADVSPGAITANGDVSPYRFNPFDSGQANADVVLAQPADYCVWNPLVNSNTLKDGSLYATIPGSTDDPVVGTLGMTSGRWYVEVTYQGGQDGIMMGITKDPNLATFPGNNDDSWAFLSYSGNKNHNGSQASYGTAFTPTGGSGHGTVVGCALDIDNRKIWWSVNGVWQASGNPVTGANAAYTDLDENVTYFWTCGIDSGGGNTSEFSINAGQKSFNFPPPEGFRPLNSSNIALEPGVSSRIVNPSKYFDTVLYTGTGAVRNVSGYNFAPDFVWIRNYTDTVNYMMFDTVRGIQKVIYSNQTTGEQPAAISVTDFHEGGFTLSTANEVNGSGDSCVAWCWKAGGNKGTFNVDDVGYASAAAAGLTAGSVTPTGASVGTRQGFSIIKWTAPDPQDNSATVPHGLTQKPEFWMVKSLDGSRDWITYTEKIDGTLDFGRLNTDGVFSNSSATAPTTTTFGVYGNDINTAGEDQIAYLWHSVPGLQKFGKYTGDHNSNPFVYLGFKPALVVIKRTDAGNNWNVQDYRRTSYNGQATTSLQWDTDVNQATIGSGYQRDQLSMGFKLQNQNTETNASGGTYIYMAWAKEAVGSMFGGQATGRGEV